MPILSTPTFWIAFAASFLLSVAVGYFVAGHFITRQRSWRERMVKNAVELAKEGDALRSTVIDFIMDAQRRQLAREDYRDLLNAVLHEGTPESIRSHYHHLCGTTDVPRAAPDSPGSRTLFGRSPGKWGSGEDPEG